MTSGTAPPAAAPPAVEPFTSRVFPAELAYLVRRWEAAGSERGPVSTTGRPSVEKFYSHGVSDYLFVKAIKPR
jgi:hypothetical protein